MPQKEYQNQEQNRRLENIEKYIGVINSELGSIKTDIAWIKRFIFILIPLLAGMIINLIYIVLEK